MAEDKFVPMERELGTRLMQLRGNKSQEAVAAELGVRRETLKQWENAERHIKAVDLVKLATHFGVSVDYLLGLTKNAALSEDIKIAQETFGLSNEAVAQLTYMKETMPTPAPLHVLNKILGADKLFEVLMLIAMERKRVTDALVDAVEVWEAVSKNKRGDFVVDYAANAYMEERGREVEFAAYKASQYFNEIISEVLRADQFDAIKAIVSATPKVRTMEEAGNAEEK